MHRGRPAKPEPTEPINYILNQLIKFAVKVVNQSRQTQTNGRREVAPGQSPPNKLVKQIKDGSHPLLKLFGDSLSDKPFGAGRAKKK